MNKRCLIIALICVLVSGIVAFAQSPQSSPTAKTGDSGITPNGVIGEVKAIDASSRQIIVKTDGGTVVMVAFDDKTSYMRVPPGEKTLDKAAKITLAEIAEGDRVYARGRVADDRKSVPARVIIVMTKAEIAKKQEGERAEWRRRGILGTITSLNPGASEIVISTRSFQGPQPVVIAVGNNVDFRRYAPDSIKFSDARPSSLAELKVGDQLRALGDKSPDGTHFIPEKIVSGAFRTVGGTVIAVDPSTGEIKIKDLQSQQPLTIVVHQDSLLRRFPPEMAARIAARSGGGGGGAGAGGARKPEGGESDPGRTGEANRQTGAAGGARGGRFDFQDMLEKMPALSLTDLKAGDMVMVSSTRGSEPSRLTAIALVSGVDALLNSFKARQQQANRPGGLQGGAGLDEGIGGGIGFGIGLP
jgi:hypothetical protein